MYFLCDITCSDLQLQSVKQRCCINIQTLIPITRSVFWTQAHNGAATWNHKLITDLLYVVLLCGPIIIYSKLCAPMWNGCIIEGICDTEVLYSRGLWTSRHGTWLPILDVMSLILGSTVMLRFMCLLPGQFRL